MNSIKLRSETFYRLMVVVLAVIASLPFYFRSRQNFVEKIPTAFSVAPPASKVVMVNGAVKYPGIYFVSDSLMTVSVIKMADPLIALMDGDQLGVYNKPVAGGTILNLSFNGNQAVAVSVSSMSVRHRILLGIPLNINEMSEADFITVPGIGPGLAKNIISYRQSVGGKISPKGLINVNGIGVTKYDQLKKYFN